MGQNFGSGLYVAADGNWGDASGMTVINDENWTEFDFAMLEAETDHNRADLAEAIEAWIVDGRFAMTRISSGDIDMTNADDVADALVGWWRGDDKDVLRLI